MRCGYPRIRPFPDMKRDLDMISSNLEPIFSNGFSQQLEQLFKWRRDVRRFRPDPLPEDEVIGLLRVAHNAPSVGNSQPWRMIRVTSDQLKEAIAFHVDACNDEAAACYSGAEQTEYRALKLHGIREAPVQIAFYCDSGPHAGRGLGRRTMEATLEWSVVMAIHSLWLAARARGIGLGWVSIVEPEILSELLSVPREWRLIGYVCLGFPLQAEERPELEILNWQARLPLSDVLFER